MDALSNINHRAHPQREQADPRQVRNHAGGFSFQATPQARLRRFLTLGVDGGTFYVKEHALAKSNAAVVIDFATHRPADLVQEILDISLAGRAPRQNPALFALAAATALGDDAGKALALAALPQVARTGTHLFTFAGYVEQFRGWGPALRRAVGNWYTGKSADDLAYQMIKYRQRDGWTHRDVLRLAHPKTDNESVNRLLSWATKGTANTTGLPLLEGFLAAQDLPERRYSTDLPALVRTYGLSWEMLPTAALNSATVWEALLDSGLPQTALIRQLPRLTRLGLLSDWGDRTGAVVTQLTDRARLRTARVHPVALLNALRTYSGGRSVKGDSTWTPSRRITDALDAAFYASFAQLEPTGQRYMLALDISGSMSWHPIANMVLTPREASAAMAMATAAVEQNYTVVGFTSSNGYNNGISPLNISPRQRLDDVLAEVSRYRMGGTDCALPMLAALDRKIMVDTFVIYTDGQTWAGSIHPHEALRLYRERMNPRAKLVFTNMEATETSLADPTDTGILDISGFDAAVPTLIGEFATEGTTRRAQNAAPTVDPFEEGKYGKGGPGTHDYMSFRG